ncbi:MAG: hypothetical protein M1826_003453 [Phylliscum demangeonii]|nr:MAG: hypothetical protein M1826_003453 [Phylliscum demangeonii]
MRPSASRSSSELSIPLINLSSRSPSPYSRKPSSTGPSDNEGGSNDDDDDNNNNNNNKVPPLRPLVEPAPPADAAGGQRADDPRRRSRSRSRSRVGGRAWRWTWTLWFENGRLGRALFGTDLGRQIYMAVLMAATAGSSFGLVVLNRLLLWTGVYKFSYPLTLTLAQVLTTHLLLLAVASLSRLAARPLTALGLSCMIAPARPLRTRSAAGAGERVRPAARNLHRHRTITARVWAGLGACVFQGGIAGGGPLELQWTTATQVLPLAVIYAAKVLLSNLSFAYAQMPMYLLARIGIVPWSLLFSASLLRVSHSVATLSSSLTATLNLLIATTHPGVRVTWESIVAGVGSSLFTALYPVVWLRTHGRLSAVVVADDDDEETSDGRASNGDHHRHRHHNPYRDDESDLDITTTTTTAAADDHRPSPSTASSHTTYLLLHYTSLLTILLLTPLVLLSGEISHMSRNCYILDLPFFWFLVIASGAVSAVVFLAVVLLTRGSSLSSGTAEAAAADGGRIGGVLLTTALFVPRCALQLVVLTKFNMPVYSWVGVGMALLASAWLGWVRWCERWPAARRPVGAGPGARVGVGGGSGGGVGGGVGGGRVRRTGGGISSGGSGGSGSRRNRASRLE